MNKLFAICIIAATAATANSAQAQTLTFTAQEKTADGVGGARPDGTIFGGQMTTGTTETVWADGKKVGVITCPSYSKLTKKSMAIMRVDVPYAKQGVKLEVRGKNVTASAIAHTISFDDPEKKKRTAVG